MKTPHPSFFRQIVTVAWKDLRSELRTREAINASVLFGVVVLVLFSAAFEPTADQTRQLAGGLLWLVFAFAGALILNRSFARELPNDCLDALIAAPMSGAALFLGKALANFALLCAVEVVCLAVFGLFYNAPVLQQIWPLAGIILLGTWGITAVGTVFSAVTVHLRLRDLILSILVYPILIPCLLAAMQLTAPLAMGDPITAELAPLVRLLVAFDVIFSALALALIESVLLR